MWTANLEVDRCVGSLRSDYIVGYRDGDGTPIAPATDDEGEALGGGGDVGVELDREIAAAGQEKAADGVVSGVVGEVVVGQDGGGAAGLRGDAYTVVAAEVDADNCGGQGGGPDLDPGGSGRACPQRGEHEQ